MTTRYHRAAADSRIEVLKEGTRKDLNQSDDDGMTPTLWAAYHGQLSALRTCCSRGGDVDKCDLLGNTALHLAAQNGHMRCVSFLVEFGANIWKLDNSYNNALALAGIREQKKCVDYLDDVINKKEAKDKKQAKKQQELARKEAEKRIVKFEKLQSKMKQKIEKNLNGPTGKVLASNVSEDKSNGRKTSSSTFTTLRKLSTSNKLDQVTRDQPQTISGIPSQKLPNVTYMPTERFNSSLSTANKRPPVNEIFPGSTDYGEEYPRFNTALKWNTKTSANAMNSLLRQQQMQDNYDDDFDEEDGAPSYVKPDYKVYESKPNYEDDLSLGHSDSAEELSELEVFLSSLRLDEYAPLFQDEKMDMETLATCTSDELFQMGLPLGPRKKILKALSERAKPESDNELTAF